MRSWGRLCPLVLIACCLSSATSFAASPPTRLPGETPRSATAASPMLYFGAAAVSITCKNGSIVTCTGASCTGTDNVGCRCSGGGNTSSASCGPAVENNN